MARQKKVKPFEAVSEKELVKSIRGVKREMNAKIKSNSFTDKHQKKVALDTVIETLVAIEAELSGLMTMVVAHTATEETNGDE